MNTSLRMQKFGDKSFGSSLNALFSFIIIILGAALTALALWYNYWLILIVVVGGIGLLTAFLRKPQLWIYTVVLSLYFFFNANQDDAVGNGLGGQEIAFGLFYHCSLFAWFIWQIFVRRKKLVRTKADRIFLLFMALLPLNFFVAYFNDVEPMLWVRGWQYYLLFFYYFPIREYFSEERDLRRLFIMWGVLGLGAGVTYLYEYKTRVLNFKWANQIYYSGVRRASFLFSMFIIVCLTGLLLDKGRIKKLLWLSFFVLSTALVIVSMARTAWISVSIAVVVLAVILPFRERLKFIVYTGGVSVILIASAFVFVPRIANMAVTIINLRFSSSSNISSDPSYLSRTMENESLMTGIVKHPLGGNGLQKEHLRYDLLDKRHIVTIYGHNGYLTLTYLIGVPMAGLFYGILAYFAFASLLRARKTADISARILYSCIGCGLVNAFVINIMGSLFDQREGIFITTFFIGLFSVAESLEARRQMFERQQNSDSTYAAYMLPVTT